MDECDLIKAFVQNLSMLHDFQPTLQIERWPDKENRQTPEIDAIAGQFAIEHTSIDVLENQRTRADWFSKVVDPLEKEFTKLTHRIEIVFPYEAICKGMRWDDVRDGLRRWITEKCQSLAEGHHFIDATAGISFSFHVFKVSSTRPKLLFSRIAPDDPSLSTRLKTHLSGKVNKLRKYKQEHKTTVLLIESDDIALMSKQLLVQSLRSAFADGWPPGLDQLWYTDTSIPSNLVFEDLTESICGYGKKERGFRPIL